MIESWANSATRRFAEEGKCKFFGLDEELSLGRFFGNSPRFWLNLQTAYELAVGEREIGERVVAEIDPAAA